MELSIARIYYPVKTLGPGNRIGIWTAGCPRRCSGCISPELQRAEAGREMTAEEILRLLAAITDPVDGITISGGEPFARPEPLSRLMRALAKRWEDILIFTGYTYEQLLAQNSAEVKTVLSLCAVLIDGPYIAQRNDGIGLRGSSNQRIHVFRDPEKYAGLAHAPRQLQNILFDDKIVTIGIPRGADK